MLFKEVIPINLRMWINTYLNTFKPRLYLKKSIKFVLNSYYTLARMLYKLPFHIVRLLLLFMVHQHLYAQISGSKDPIILNHADLMEGKETASGSIRELKGNVSISQGNVILSCSHAIEYIQQNLVELSGDVILKQGSLTLSTPFAYLDTSNDQGTMNISELNITEPSDENNTTLNTNDLSIANDNINNNTMNTITPIESNELSISTMDTDLSSLSGNTTTEEVSMTFGGKSLYKRKRTNKNKKSYKKEKKGRKTRKTRKTKNSKKNKSNKCIITI